ncbi:DUF465 domain-containing protein [Sphingorhabdus lutea]|uniref:DUF465 domain-containing protein n=1 Tax=Sphingorhabdus lutea TaxID=1913578 RepID=UPI0009340407|nr:DUF465 domain-containing protein [Sphingorhabdus lutea]
MNNSHMSALKTKHEDLQHKLDQEANRPFPDMGIINKIKKMKLKIKEEMRQHSLA